MLVNEIYLGSGIGNQIWTSVVTRIIAEKLGYKYGIKGKELWKGAGWMPFFWGEEVVGGTSPDDPGVGFIGQPGCRLRHLTMAQNQQREASHVAGLIVESAGDQICRLGAVEALEPHEGDDSLRPLAAAQ